MQLQGMWASIVTNVKNYLDTSEQTQLTVNRLCNLAIAWRDFCNTIQPACPYSIIRYSVFLQWRTELQLIIQASSKNVYSINSQTKNQQKGVDNAYWTTETGNCNKVWCLTFQKWSSHPLQSPRLLYRYKKLNNEEV